MKAENRIICSHQHGRGRKSQMKINGTIPSRNWLVRRSTGIKNFRRSCFSASDSWRNSRGSCPHSASLLASATNSGIFIARTFTFSWYVSRLFGPVLLPRRSRQSALLHCIAGRRSSVPCSTLVSRRGSLGGDHACDPQPRQALRHRRAQHRSVIKWHCPWRIRRSRCNPALDWASNRRHS